MQEFNIKGKVTAIAEVKTQLDNSPLALPPPENMSDVIQPLGEAENNFSDTIKNNTSIMQEFGTSVSDFAKNLQNLNSQFQQNTAKDYLSNKPLVDQQEQIKKESVQNLVDAQNDSIDSMKEFGNIMPELIKNLRSMNDAVNQSSRSLPSVINRNNLPEDSKKNLLDNYNRQNILGLLNTGSNAVQALSYGNTAGAANTVVGGVANTVDNMSKMAKLNDLADLSKGLLIGGGVIAAGAALMKGAEAMANSYKDAMPTIFNTGKAFGTTDTNKSFELYRTVNDYNKGTNLDIDSFNSIVQSLRKQGVGSEYKSKENQAVAASQIAETTSRWAYATNGNAEQYAQLAGLMSRYGGSKDVSADFNYLVSVGKASGLNDSQIPEFLSAIQKTMEEGIAKGFSRSATEVADTLSMFSKMSGNYQYWMGEQGSKLLSQANAGIAGATNLAKTEDILIYRAMNKAYAGTTKDKNGNIIDKKKNALGETYVDNGDYINTMQLIEKGINTENFDEIMGSLDAYGNNTAAKIEALRNMTGLNYTGASRLYNLGLEGNNVTTEKLKEIFEAPENKNDETKWKDSLNKISEALQTGGKPLFNVELAGMTKVSDLVERIADKVAPSEEVIYTSPVVERQMAKDKEFADNYKSAERKARELPEWRQGLIDEKAASEGFDPGENGENYVKLVDTVANLKPGDTWNPASVTEATIEDLEPGFLLAHQYDEDSTAIDDAIKAKGYRIVDFGGDSGNRFPINLSDSIFGIWGNEIGNILSSGNISLDAFMEAVKNSPDVKNEIRKDWKTDYVEPEEFNSMLKILNKIHEELVSGITVTAER